MEMNIHTILLTGHFNNLKLDTREHSFVTDIRINRKNSTKSDVYSFIELFLKLLISYVQLQSKKIFQQNVSQHS